MKKNKESEMVGNILSIYIASCSRCTWEWGSKNFMQESCAQKVEMLYPVETRNVFKREKEKSFHMISQFLSSSVRENIDIYQTVCSSFLISCSLFL